MLTLTINLDGVETVYTYSDLDVKAVRNDILAPAQWIADAFTGKVNNCKSRLVRPDGEHIQKLYADPTVESFPANQDALIALITSRPDYKDRAARELEATLIDKPPITKPTTR